MWVNLLMKLIKREKLLKTKLKIKIGKRLFRQAYVNYTEFRLSADCGETLLLAMSTTACKLRRKMEKRHYGLKKIDPQCPNMEYLIFQKEKK